jgi:arginyl-tRNA synthetase
MERIDLPTDYRSRVDSELAQVALRIKENAHKRVYVDYTSYPLSKIKAELAAELKVLGIEGVDVPTLILSLPPNQVAADLTFPVFQFSKVAKKAPVAIAAELATVINARKAPGLIESAVAVGGYVNINLSRAKFFQETLDKVLSLADKFGESDRYKGKTVFIDYSSPNIAKPFGLGHLRSTVIGEALARIYGATGYTTIRDNHLGDWGTQFGSLIYAYKKWGDEKVIEANPIEELKNLYVRFSTEAEENPSLKDEARKIFAKLEDGDPELFALWSRFKNLSIAEFQKTYEELNIRFDMMLGESYYANGSEKLVVDLRQKGLATDGENGSVIVEGLQKLPTFLLQKGDGSTLYALRDMQAVIHRKAVFNPSVILYLVGVEQDLNFKQLFALAKASGYAGDTELRHIGFGLVLVDGKKMATRKGTLINLSDVIQQITDKAKEIIVKRGENVVGDADATAKKVALSAVVYNDLRQNRLSDIEFDWEKMLSLDSGSVVYLQYAYARISSIVKKANVADLEGVKSMTFEDPTEFNLALRLSLFPETILHVIENDTPHLVCDFLEALSADINRFYTNVSVSTTEDQTLRRSRLVLLRSVMTCMENAFHALNIPIIDRL